MPSQFRRVVKSGVTLSGKYLLIQVCQCRRSSLKLGITVSRKFGNAVKRNRFKRVVREAFRLSQYDLPNDIHLNIRPSKLGDHLILSEIQAELLYLVTNTQIT